MRGRNAKFISYNVFDILACKLWRLTLWWQNFLSTSIQTHVSNWYVRNSDFTVFYFELNVIFHSYYNWKYRRIPLKLNADKILWAQIEFVSKKSSLQLKHVCLITKADSQWNLHSMHDPFYLITNSWKYFLLFNFFSKLNYVKIIQKCNFLMHPCSNHLFAYRYNNVQLFEPKIYRCNKWCKTVKYIRIFKCNA